MEPAPGPYVDTPGIATTRFTQRMSLKQQQQARSRLRQQRLKVSFFGYLVVLVFFAVLQFIGIYFFAKGFLLSRQVLPNVAECGDDGCLPPQFEKTVIVVIDALRFDFAIPVEESQADPYYHNNFPILHDLMQKQPDNAVLLKFLADPPTTTLQRLKGLTTGSLPTFIDAGSNFDGDAIDEDNWLLQLHKRNKSIAFMGDDTWNALFKHYINPELHFPYDSLNVWDLHTVDNGVIEHMVPLLDQKRAKEWDLLVGHFLGVDHVGHRYGPHHLAMRDKLHQMNTFIEDTINKIDDKTLLIVMGDHGMDPTGNHGGDSIEELESTIFFYSKNRKFHINKHDAADYDTSDLGKNYRSVNQIDLVPTISLLMGMPVPHNNLGFPIDEVFGNNKDLSSAARITVEQINRFRGLSAELRSDEKLTEKFEFISDNFTKYGKNKKYYADLISESKAYQRDFLDHCKGLWARFDLVLIGLGVSVMLLSLSFVLTYSRSIPSVRVSTMSFEFIGSIIAMTLLGLVSSISIFIVLRPSGVTLRTCLLLGCAIGISIGFWAPIMDRFSLLWLWQQVEDFFHYNVNGWSTMGLLMVLFHSTIFASNSYVIWEDKLVSFFLTTFGFCCFFGCLRSSKPYEQRILGASHAATFILLTRLVSMINLCREEQRPLCTPTFKTTWWSVLLLHICAYILPTVIKSFYKFTASYHSAGPLWIGTGMKFLMLMNASYWTIEYFENNDYFQEKAKAFLEIGLTKSLKLGIARIVLFIALVLANFSWSRGPLCVKIELSDSQESDHVETSSSSDDEDGETISPRPRQPRSPSATILGYGNVYGSSYFLLVINVACAVLLVTKPLGAISICMMIVQLLSLLELYETLGLQRNLVAVVVFGLLGYQHFFSTGHQATIPSIQWDIGFLTTQTISFPFTHLNILLNTFGSFFIICIAVPLITLWRIPPSTKPITLLSQVVTNVTTLLTYQTIISIMSFIFAAHFRRHLMVWKIFAPRFMLSALLLIVFNVTLTFGTMWFATSRVLTQVNRIFAKNSVCARDLTTYQAAFRLTNSSPTTMCRFMIYKGKEPMMLSDLLTKPAHSIINQSFDSRLRIDMRNPINGDGFGVGYYRKLDQPCIFKAITPAWNNVNLNSLSNCTESSLVFGHVRASTQGVLSETNCHPFSYGRIMFMHNGGVSCFDKIKKKLINHIDDKFFTFIQGSTDSECCCALLLDTLYKMGYDAEDPKTVYGHKVLRQAILRTIELIKDWQCEVTDEPSLLNFAVTDGESVVITRYITSKTDEAASLHFSTGSRFLEYDTGLYKMERLNRSQDVVFVASEPLTFERGDWICVPTNTTLTITSNNTVLMHPIEDEFWSDGLAERSSGLAMRKGLMGGVPTKPNTEPSAEDEVDSTVAHLPPLQREGRRASEIAS